MPIANYRHHLRTTNGEPVFLIETPLPVTRKFLGRTFVDGRATTTNEELARRFAEEFGYTVVLPEDYEGDLGMAEAPAVSLGTEYQETGFVVEDDDAGLILEEVRPKRGR